MCIRFDAINAYLSVRTLGRLGGVVRRQSIQKLLFGDSTKKRDNFGPKTKNNPKSSDEPDRQVFR